MKDNIRLTFDKSAAEFILKAFDFSVTQGGVICSNVTYEMGNDVEVIAEPLECCVCKNKVRVNDLAGIIHHEGKPALICKSISCMIEKYGENNDK